MSQSQGHVEQYFSTVIIKGLKAALADSPIEDPISSFSDSHIKLNKLMYMAAEEKDLLDELQHSWHIFGSDLGDLVPSTQTVHPIAIQKLPRTQTPESPDLQGGSSTVYSEDDFHHFFTNISLGGLGSLEEILEADRVELLDEFYNQYSREIGDFYDLYSYNVQFQRILEEHQGNIDVDDIGLEEYSHINTLTRGMRDEFLGHEEFHSNRISELGVELENDISQMFIVFLTLADDIYFALARKSSADIEGDASHIISEIKSFYLNNAWKAVTEIISFHTIRGPRQDSLKKGARIAIENVDNRYETKFSSLVTECTSANFLPIDEDESQQSGLSPEESLELLDSSELISQ